MAVDISGPGGNFSTNSAGFVGHISGWAGNLNITLVETTGFVDVGNRTYDATALVITGSADGTAQTVNLPVASGGLGATPSMGSYAATITLTAAAGDTWQFPAKMSMVAINRRHDGKADLSFNFVSSGAITQSWS